MFKRLYEWTLSLAESRHAPVALGVVSFAESSFFPIPPDVILVPMALARPDRAWFYAGLCTITSVLGGLFGYAIGFLLFDTVGQWVINFYGYGQKIESFRQTYAEYGHWAILLKGLTPIPYKLVTITSGFAGYDLFWFVVLSLITRGARFYIEVGLLNRFGGPVRALLDRHGGLVVGLVGVTVIGGFVIARYAF